MATECRIKCHARKGLFEDEMVVRLVTIDADGNQTEAECLAYGKSVTIEGAPDASGESPALLHAYCLAENAELVAVVLPQSTFQNGPSVILPQSEMLEE